MIGLFVGTIVLLLLVRGLPGPPRTGWIGGAATDSRALIGVFLAFVVASFLVTRSVVKRMYRVTSARARRLAFGALIIPGALSMWAWSDLARLRAGVERGRGAIATAPATLVADARVAETTDLRQAGHFATGGAFQRGRLFRLREGAWLVPLPNDAEMPRVLSDAAGRIIAVVDLADTSSGAWVTRARRALASDSGRFMTIPFTEADARNPDRVALLVNRLRSERAARLTIVAPRTPTSSSPAERGTRVARAILGAFDVAW